MDNKYLAQQKLILDDIIKEIQESNMANRLATEITPDMRDVVGHNFMCDIERFVDIAIDAVNTLDGERSLFNDIEGDGCDNHYELVEDK